MSARPRVWTVFAGFVVVLVAIQVAGALVLGAWAYLHSPPGSGATGVAASLDSLLASPSGLALAAVVSAAGLAIGALLGAALSREPWRRRLRLSLQGVTAGRLALVVVGLLAVSQALDAAVTLSGWSGFGALDHINRVLSRASGGWLVAFCFALALGPGVAEELFFRGYVQTRLSQRFGAIPAVLVAAACFGFIHFDLVHTPVAAMLGLFLGWSVERTGTVVPAMAAHVANNLVAVLTARFSWPPTTGTSVTVLLVSAGVAAACVVVLDRRCRTAPAVDAPTAVDDAPAADAPPEDGTIG